ncbi:MAG: PatB family C-S lyase [Oceanospirillaceae bacterium]|nr:PatB family C-S lyase [Oceanospirillaceae bacterium]
MANNNSYDFDTVTDRHNTHSLKWAKYKGADVIPLWVADTDFKVAPVIQTAIEERVQHGIFGYTRTDQKRNQIVVDYYKNKYGCDVDADWIVWVPGIVASLTLAIRSLSKQHKQVLTPDIVYPYLHTTPTASGKQANHLAMTYTQDRLRIDIDALEKCNAQDAKVMLFCNPQNPGGTIYTRAELERIDAYCEANNLILVSDEIHADIILDEDKRHLPYLDVSPHALNNSIVLSAASKAFNVAGLACSWAVIANPEIRNAFKAEMHGIISEINPLGFTATLTALEHGDDWLQAMNVYLRHNRDYLMAEFADIRGIRMLPLESTFLAWLDVSELDLEDPVSFFEAAGVGLSSGQGFNDANFLRLNFGCTRSVLEQAVQRIKKVLA